MKEKSSNSINPHAFLMVNLSIVPITVQMGTYYTIFYIRRVVRFEIVYTWNVLMFYNSISEKILVSIKSGIVKLLWRAIKSSCRKSMAEFFLKCLLEWWYHYVCFAKLRKAIYFRHFWLPMLPSVSGDRNYNRIVISLFKRSSHVVT